ncbi:6-phospho-3-hexuloisomerase [Catenisphaera adipataccumulans]|jgi:6-phospho-3-hexuloisomerase|uniref:6-phospho-3-hexuloisomerase n=1 Tax=Catenisphaera adipataccumulans TaxID=700500 RepID=A0A7W8CW89_9FIRM|nr:6-phospho-3-hexuloisomerase [Catenisphaera adipataccumulans]MBB5182743.1 6-phospho-3-hexuloisomerase [Catenisphaera adipataccumulans]
MKAKKLQIISEEISKYSQYVTQEDIDRFVQAILKAKRIFVNGAGRSGFAARAFSNRLMHLGLTVYFVGEPTTPSIHEGDLLVIGSGSGTTASLVSNAKKAKSTGASIATLTIDPKATIGSMADVVVVIPGATPKNEEVNNTNLSQQPMGSLFEQLSWLTYDSVIMELMPLLHQTEDEMFSRHANME